MKFIFDFTKNFLPNLFVACQKPKPEGLGLLTGKTPGLVVFFLFWAPFGRPSPEFGRPKLGRWGVQWGALLTVISPEISWRQPMRESTNLKNLPQAHRLVQSLLARAVVVQEPGG